MAKYVKASYEVVINIDATKTLKEQKASFKQVVAEIKDVDGVKSVKQIAE